MIHGMTSNKVINVITKEGITCVGGNAICDDCSKLHPGLKQCL